MQRLQPTPALQECPQLSRLHVFSARNQGLVADYLAHLRARHYAPAMQEATIRALRSFAVLMPEVRQATLDQVVLYRSCYVWNTSKNTIVIQHVTMSRIFTCPPA